MTDSSFGKRKRAPMPVMRKFSRAGNAPRRMDLTDAPSVEDELRLWKKSRGFAFPLRPLALMASLCFAVASFVLPAAVNDLVQYPLYALSAASLYAGFRRKRALADKDAVRAR